MLRILELRDDAWYQMDFIEDTIKEIERFLGGDRRLSTEERKKVFGTFISFFRSFISRFRGESSFAPLSFPISSGETGLSEDVRVAVKRL